MKMARIILVSRDAARRSAILRLTAQRERLGLARKRFDEGGAKESERDGPADPAFAFAFARGERFDGLVGTGGQLVKPAMSVAKRISEDSPRFGSHRTRGGGSFALALNDLAATVGRRRRPGKIRMRF